jgi:hypothetical protein
VKRGYEIVAALLTLAMTAGTWGASIDIVPIRSSGNGSVDGNEIIVTQGEKVEVEVRVSGFGDTPVAAYQGAIDCSSLDASVSGQLLAISIDCTIVGEFNVDYCLGVDENNPTYILANAGSTLPACQNISSCPDGDPGAYACGAVSIFGDSGPDNGNPYYAITFGFDVSADFKGTAAFTLNPDPNQTFFKDPMARDIPIDVVNPALITVPIGACCGAGGPLDCQSNLTEAECSSQGGAWQPGLAECTGIPNPGGQDRACPCCVPGEDQFCDDDNDCTVDTCDPLVCCVYTDVTPAGFCCSPLGGSLIPIDDGDPCTDDECQPDGSVTHDPSPAGTTCDDDNGCTAFDECDGAGACGGTDINTLACNSIDDCPPGSQSCEEGSCVCALETKLDIVVQDSGNGDTSCFSEGDAVAVDIVAGAGSECVAGAQFLVNYDPSCLAFEGLAGGATYPMTLFTAVDETAGTVFAAVGVMPGGPCSQGPDVLATISFSKLGECGACNLSFGDVNPQNTILTNDEGNSVPLDLNDSGFISLAGDISLSSPEGTIETNPDCDMPVATVTWDDLAASDSCGDEITIECESVHEAGVNIDHLAANGGIFPQGLSTFSCTASNSCGAIVTNEWMVIVSDEHALDVEVQLGGGVIVGDPLTRCICFEFYSDCVQEPISWCSTLVFGFPYDFAGHWRGELKIPKGQYACVTAEDPLHSLRSVASLDCVDNILVAEFKGDPAFDGNWLVGGNLDGFDAEGNGDTIDMIDYGMFASQYHQTVDPNAPCDTEWPHGDIIGDGIVDGADFGFISVNYLATSKNSCCEDSTASGGETPITSITLKQLRRMGFGDLVVADLDGNGIVDAEDMTAFASGVIPRRDASSERGKRAGSLGR